MTWYCSSQAGHPGVCTSRTAPAVVALFFAQLNGTGVIAILAESPQHHHPSISVVNTPIRFCCHLLRGKITNGTNCLK